MPQTFGYYKSEKDKKEKMTLAVEELMRVYKPRLSAGSTGATKFGKHENLFMLEVSLPLLTPAPNASFGLPRHVPPTIPPCAGATHIHLRFYLTHTCCGPTAPNVRVDAATDILLRGHQQRIDEAVVHHLPDCDQPRHPRRHGRMIPASLQVVLRSL